MLTAEAALHCVLSCLPIPVPKGQALSGLKVTETTDHSLNSKLICVISSPMGSHHYESFLKCLKSTRLGFVVLVGFQSAFWCLSVPTNPCCKTGVRCHWPTVQVFTKTVSSRGQGTFPSCFYKWDPGLTEVFRY